MGSILESDLKDWELVFDTNFWGPLKLVPHMVDNKGAAFVFNSTQVFEHGFAICGAYSTSKAAVTALADTLRNEVKGYDLQPGSIKTPFLDKSPESKTSVPFLQPIVEWIHSARDKAPLDPVKGAGRILDILASGELLPERLPFGQQAFNMMIPRLEARLADFKRNRAWSVGLDYAESE
ncbi:hypothetical protein BD324DRAFT_210498 [Kockovaella imperatae]|uniref:Uncharacterized protein n=1 Tax=Kockovaella imperatae TaxID=4999 RepID=A0A1Y1U6N6_9TREE|nr:hypothetical protein BD324DRAFT_210498 [Kockovaella imperatae]ORX33662.1 hypothetical protein BD324DRAFT_210498 [Kockovaella imperatae]